MADAPPESGKQKRKSSIGLVEGGLLFVGTLTAAIGVCHLPIVNNPAKNEQFALADLVLATIYKILTHAIGPIARHPVPSVDIKQTATRWFKDPGFSEDKNWAILPIMIGFGMCYGLLKVGLEKLEANRKKDQESHVR